MVTENSVIIWPMLGGTHEERLVHVEGQRLRLAGNQIGAKSRPNDTRLGNVGLDFLKLTQPMAISPMGNSRSGVRKVDN